MSTPNINFGPVMGASGVQGFYGEGYSWHSVAQWLGLNFSGMTFVAKTVTWEPREGNMPREDAPWHKRLLPDCIIAKPLRADPVGLNSVGLTNKGFMAHLTDGKWQTRTKPFLISFMSLAGDHALRLIEFVELLTALRTHKHAFKAPFGLQVNISCPNTHVDLHELNLEVNEILEILEELEVPIFVKINVLYPVHTALEFAGHPACSGICISNAIPWRALPEQIDWDRYFGSNPESPLVKRGYTGGDLSGAPLLPLVRNWVLEARRLGYTGHINAGGGILCAEDAISLFQAGATSIFVGSAAFLRPWQVPEIIDVAHYWAPRQPR